MTLIYAGFEQLGNPTLKRKQTDATPISTQHSIQVVYTGFEQMDSMLCNTTNPCPKNNKPLQGFW